MSNFNNSDEKIKQDEIYIKTMKRLNKITSVKSDKEAVIILSKEVNYYRNKIKDLEDFLKEKEEQLKQ